MMKLYKSGELLDAEITDLLIEELFFDRLSSSSSSSSLEDSSSSEDEIKQPRKKHYRKSYVTLQNYTEEEFLEHFKITKRVANNLIAQLEVNNVLPTHKSGPEKISSERALLLTLWYLTNQDSFRLVSQKFSVSLSTAHRILSRVINFLITLRDEFITWPDEDESRDISAQFKADYKLDGVVGAIDICHVRIKKPSNSGHQYKNKWGYYSILLQAVVDCNHTFRDVYCGEPGSLTKWKLLQRSSLYSNSREYFAFDHCLIGGASYPSGMHWLVTPFTGEVSEEQATFNYQHEKCTNTNVKGTLMMLKRRFKRLENFDNLDVQFIVNSIMAACILHNICVQESDDYFATRAIILDAEEEEEYDSEVESFESLGNDRRQEVFNRMFE